MWRAMTGTTVHFSQGCGYSSSRAQLTWQVTMDAPHGMAWLPGAFGSGCLLTTRATMTTAPRDLLQRRCDWDRRSRSLRRWTRMTLCLLQSDGLPCRPRVLERILRRRKRRYLFQGRVSVDAAMSRSLDLHGRMLCEVLGCRKIRANGRKYGAGRGYSSIANGKACCGEPFRGTSVTSYELRPDEATRTFQFNRPPKPLHLHPGRPRPTLLDPGLSFIHHSHTLCHGGTKARKAESHRTKSRTAKPPGPRTGLAQPLPGQETAPRRLRSERRIETDGGKVLTAYREPLRTLADFSRPAIEKWSDPYQRISRGLCENGDRDRQIGALDPIIAVRTASGRARHYWTPNDIQAICNADTGRKRITRCRTEGVVASRSRANTEKP